MLWKRRLALLTVVAAAVVAQAFLASVRAAIKNDPLALPWSVVVGYNVLVSLFVVAACAWAVWLARKGFKPDTVDLLILGAPSLFFAFYILFWPWLDTTLVTQRILRGEISGSPLAQVGAVVLGFLAATKLRK